MRLSTERRVARLVAALALLWAARALAAPDADVTAAARAFEEGQRAQLRGDYAHAAELFELADHTVPSAQALRSAIRNFEAAGNPAHAVNLALRAQERYPGDNDTRKLADGVLARLAPKLGHVIVSCTPDCALAVDGRAATASAEARHELYLAPGDHQLEARYEQGRGEPRTLHMNAGDTEQLSLHPTAALAAQTAAAVVPPRRDRRLPPVYVAAAAAVTVTLAAVLIWSGADTLQARDRYASDPTEAGFHDGVGREARTNGLIGATVVLGAATVGLAIFTRWHGPFAGSAREQARAALGLGALGLGALGGASAAGY
jgi:hypothetical protein